MPFERSIRTARSTKVSPPRRTSALEPPPVTRWSRSDRPAARTTPTRGGSIVRAAARRPSCAAGSCSENGSNASDTACLPGAHPLSGSDGWTEVACATISDNAPARTTLPRAPASTYRHGPGRRYACQGEVMGIRDRIAPPELLGRSAVVGLTAFLVLGIAGTTLLLATATDRMIFLVFGSALLLVFAGLLPRMLRAARAIEGHNARLQEAEAKYRSLVDQIPAIVYLAEFGPEGDWVYVSAEIEPMLGYTPEEWMAHPHPFASHLHPDDKPRVIEAEERSRAEGHVYHAEYRMHRRDGELLWIRDDAFPVRDVEGRPLFIQGIMYDITDRKAAEDELSKLLTKEREAASRLRAVDEMKNMFLQAVSHELRTPLTQVLGIGLTLQHKDLNLTTQQEEEFLNGLVRAARKLDGLLSDLLDVDRLGRGILKPTRRLIDVGSFVRQLVETSEVPEARTVHVDAPALEAEVDSSKVERIVENLLSNAVR